MTSRAMTLLKHEDLREAIFGRATADALVLTPLLDEAQITEATVDLARMAGLYPAATRWLALGLFLVLMEVSLYQGLAGEQSCGCFGRFKTSLPAGAHRRTTRPATPGSMPTKTSSP